MKPRNEGATLAVDRRPADAPRGAAASHRPPGQALRAVPWVLPAGLLIFGVVLFPAGLLIFNSTRDIGLSGLDMGSAGLENYRQLGVGYSLTTGAAASACWFTAMTIEIAAHVRMLGLVEVLFGYGVTIFALREHPSRREVAGTALLVLAISALLWDRAGAS